MEGKGNGHGVSPRCAGLVELVELHVGHRDELGLERDRGRLEVHDGLLEVVVALFDEELLRLGHAARVGPRAVEEDHGHARRAREVVRGRDVARPHLDNLADRVRERSEELLVQRGVCRGHKGPQDCERFVNTTALEQRTHREGRDRCSHSLPQRAPASRSGAVSQSDRSGAASRTAGPGPECWERN